MEHLLHPRQCSKPFRCMASFNPHSSARWDQRSEPRVPLCSPCQDYPACLLVPKWLPCPATPHPSLLFPLVHLPGSFCTNCLHHIISLLQPVPASHCLFCTISTLYTVLLPNCSHCIIEQFITGLHNVLLDDRALCANCFNGHGLLSKSITFSSAGTVSFHFFWLLRVHAGSHRTGGGQVGVVGSPGLILSRATQIRKPSGTLPMWSWNTVSIKLLCQQAGGNHPSSWKLTSTVGKGYGRGIRGTNLGDKGLIPESGRSAGAGNSNPLQYSCLENPMDREAWRATVHGVTKSRTQPKRLSTKACIKWPQPPRSYWHPQRYVVLLLTL